MIKKRWRPSKLNEIIVGKLEEIFKRGWNVSEACSYAGINRDTYYEYLKRNKEFSDRMERARIFPFIYAKKKIFEAISSKDINISAKYALEFLRRRDPEWKDKRDNTLNPAWFSSIVITDATTCSKTKDIVSEVYN